jgi:hypothetical protein
MNATEYLVKYGRAAFLGRFGNASRIAFGHGDRVVLRTGRGLQIGAVLSEATPRFANLVAEAAEGDIVRAVTREDEHQEAELAQLARRLLSDAQDISESLQLPLTILDLEMPLDGTSAVLHVLPNDDSELAGLAEALSLRHGISFAILDLRRKPAVADEGCGKPGCGSTGGGCSSCGSGGGCSTGNCSRGAASAEELTAHFANLRRQMEQQDDRILLHG